MKTQKLGLNNIFNASKLLLFFKLAPWNVHIKVLIGKIL